MRRSGESNIRKRSATRMYYYSYAIAMIAYYPLPRAGIDPNCQMMDVEMRGNLGRADGPRICIEFPNASLIS